VTHTETTRSSGRDHGWWSAFGKDRRKGKRPGPPVHDDLVQRTFSAKCVDQLWFSDITEHPTGEGKLYLCAVKDACSGRIVGYSISDRMKARIAVDAITSAAQRRDICGAHLTTGVSCSPGRAVWCSVRARA
jgi:putative transposase